MGDKLLLILTVIGFLGNALVTEIFKFGAFLAEIWKSG